MADKQNKNSEESEATMDATSCLHDLLVGWWSPAISANDNAEDRIQRLAFTHPQIFSQLYQDIFDRRSYPLTMVCEGNRDARVETIIAVHSAYPPALRIPCRSDLPIHKACKSGLSVDIIRYLHKQFPESAVIRDSKGRTPLYLACCFGYAYNMSNAHQIASYLIEACPEAVTITTADFDLPLHVVLRQEGNLTLHQIETLVDLLGKATHTASTRDRSRKLPLRLLLENPTFSSNTKLALAKRLYEAYPQGIHSQFLWRRSSWDILKSLLGSYLRDRCSKSADYPTRYPLHAILHVYSIASNSSLLIRAISRFRKEVNCLDDQHCLPLHLALDRAQREKDRPDTLPISTMKELLLLEPRAALIRHPVTGLYPFMTAATLGTRDHDNRNQISIAPDEVSDVRWLDLTYRSFRVEPHSFLSGIAE